MTQPREIDMAGQPPEPSFQPTQQDQGMTQGRPAWQPPTYTPPGGSGQPGYPAPPFSAPGQDQVQAQSYPPPDQTYTSLGPGPGPGQYQGYQPPSYAQPGQGAAVPPPQWQASAVSAPAKPRQRAAGEKGFLGSLFDFSFTSLVTPKIVKVLYILFTIWTALIGLSILVIGFKTGGVAGGLFTLIIVEPIFVLLTLGIYRVVLELFVVVFRIYDELKKISENTDGQA
jgi:uncharacterized membrane protein